MSATRRIIVRVPPHLSVRMIDTTDPELEEQRRVAERRATIEASRRVLGDHPHRGFMDELCRLEADPRFTGRSRRRVLALLAQGRARGW